jgi:hypothetical protein
MLFSSKVPEAYLWARTVMLKENKNETVATT